MKAYTHKLIINLVHRKKYERVPYNSIEEEWMHTIFQIAGNVTYNFGDNRFCYVYNDTSIMMSYLDGNDQKQIFIIKLVSQGLSKDDYYTVKNSKKWKIQSAFLDDKELIDRDFEYKNYAQEIIMKEMSC